MFEDVRSIPPLMALLWTALMFWGGLAWMIFTILANAQIKVNKTLSGGVGDFYDLPSRERAQIEKVCRKRLWAPFKLWLKGLLIITVIGTLVFAPH